jgi:hypothetical protein
MEKFTPDFLKILKILFRHKVEFIVVGGVCAVFHGAPVTTFDLDVVHCRRRANIGRLNKALVSLGAYYRTRKDKCIIPTTDHLASPGHQLLMTQYGPLDLLGTIGTGHGYETLLPETREIEIGKIKIRILNLDKLIQVKKETLSEKDKIVIPILNRLLEEKKES